MELERQRQMELLHTPKSEIKRMMAQDSLNMNEIVFLCISNKVNAIDIRTLAPAVCDKLLSEYLRQLTERHETAEVAPTLMV